MPEQINTNTVYLCCRNIFAFINNKLNEQGLMAQIINASDMISFKIVERT